ncbi:EexN family lipoprotein [Rhizobium sp. AB2/73]|uniref:EexN family lipoprotein n=1 Tax=Rhizobium sp. AB2/73 TaxID=2795216 RepID=UPI001C5F7E2F|nr:EexN family lipoprotein [Rhizobium sp. AB2/73]QYA13713.1 EexN family lipoprotein [Rhizobium sp. AB2/73]UEQ80357.1 EexN family lipoprotein [Rhizobium sp. AB2/73]
MKFLVLLKLGVSLFGFTKPERIYSVDELMANQTLLSDLIAKCKSNPGELRAAPNCVNAEAADWKSRLERMGKTLGG